MMHQAAYGIYHPWLGEEMESYTRILGGNSDTLKLFLDELCQGLGGNSFEPLGMLVDVRSLDLLVHNGPCM